MPLKLSDFRHYQQLTNLDLLARQVVEGFITGLHKSPYHGFSVEFAEHRLYNTGESTKHIDWKLFARTDKLFVKRFEEETNLRSQIVLDTSSSMLFPFPTKKIESKLSFSLISAAALIYLLRKQRDAVGLTLLSDIMEESTVAKLSETHAQRLLAILQNLSDRPPQLHRPANLPEQLHVLTEKVHKRSLIIIFSDFLNVALDELFAALQHMRYNKHEVILFQVLDSELEQNFEYKNRPHQFVDMETGEKIKLNPGVVRTQYRQRTQEYLQHFKLRCAQHQIDLVEADIREDFNKVLSNYLLKRKKLH